MSHTNALWPNVPEECERRISHTPKSVGVHVALVMIGSF